MPVGYRQQFITTVLGDVLGITPQHTMFDWLVNKPDISNFGPHYDAIDQIFRALQGDRMILESKRAQMLRPDAYFGEHYNFLCEFDEVQHFSARRLLTLNMYPNSLKLGYNVQNYKDFCKQLGHLADKYRRNKITSEFPFVGGRTAQRAYFDCYRDFLPSLHGLNPTLRIAEFEVADIIRNDQFARDRLRKLIMPRIEAILDAP